MMTRILATILLVVVPALAQAHYLWIETGDNGEARIYFGEFNEGKREISGGRLDERDAIEGELVSFSGETEPLRFEKKSDHFQTKPAQQGWLLVEDQTNEVKDWTSSGIGVVKPMFYARAATSGDIKTGKPSLTLDIIPSAEDPHQLQIFFQQKPLAKAKVIVHAPNLWSKELTADDAGKVKIETPWPGQYVVEVIYKELKPGEFEGKPYEAIRHRVTWTQVY